MASIGSILSIATSALRAQQQGINVTSHNIANAHTEGYSRQLPVLETWPPHTTPQGVFGNGVRVGNVIQVRDSLLDQSYLRENGAGSEARTLNEILAQIEGVFGEPSESGLLAAGDRLYSAFSELATRPGSMSARSLLRETGMNLAGRFQGFSASITELRVSSEGRLGAAVDKVNDLLRDIAAINPEIVGDEAGGLVSGDLRDRRQLLIDELSTYLPIQVTERSNGAVGVTSGGLSLVDGARATDIEVRNVAGTMGIGVVGRAGLLPDVRGMVGGLLKAVNTEIPGLMTRLDALAAALIADVNAIHQTGTTPAGNTGVDFFSGTGASDIQVSAAVLADVGDIAAGTDDGAGTYLAGANDVALALAQLRDTDDLGGLGTSFQEYYQQVVTDVGFEVQSTGRAAEVHEVLAERADTLRASVSGVSTDEELVRLIQFQTGYQAAARIIQVAEELLDTLVNL